MLVADTFEQLHAQLRSVDVDVPARAEGRTKNHTEIYSIVRLLSSIPFGLSEFPLELVKRERPDFLLTIAGRCVGIEHTEAISENAAKEAFLRSKGHGPERHFVREATVNERRKTSKALIAEIEADKPSPGWVGDSVERGWAEALAHFISTKVNIANRSGFDLFEENWLLVYDNWPGVALQYETALPMLLKKLQDEKPWGTFSRVYVLDERILIQISECGCRFHAVNHCRP